MVKRRQGHITTILQLQAPEWSIQYTATQPLKQISEKRQTDRGCMWGRDRQLWPSNPNPAQVFFCQAIGATDWRDHLHTCLPGKGGWKTSRSQSHGGLWVADPWWGWTGFSWFCLTRALAEQTAPGGFVWDVMIYKKTRRFPEMEKDNEKLSSVKVHSSFWIHLCSRLAVSWNTWTESCILHVFSNRETSSNSCACSPENLEQM